MDKIFLLAAAILLYSVSARSENLNLKFGPTWSCRMISAELATLYNDCLDCERHHQDFNQKNEEHGTCEARGSLRDALRRKLQDADEGAPEVARQPGGQEQIDARVNAKEKANQQRMREDGSIPTRESGVSGLGSGPSRPAAAPSSAVQTATTQRAGSDQELKGGRGPGPGGVKIDVTPSRRDTDLSDVRNKILQLTPSSR